MRGVGAPSPEQGAEVSRMGNTGWVAGFAFGLGRECVCSWDWDVQAVKVESVPA